MTASRKRIRLGDIVEIQTPGGLAYLQYTSRHPRLGDTVRVLPGLFAERPAAAELNALAAKEGYFTFYPVGAAIRQGLVEIAANCPIALNLEAPSALRRIGSMTPEGKVVAWRISDGTKEALVKRELTAEERRIPIASIWNHEFLVSRLSEQWRPEHETGEPPPTPPKEARPEAPPSSQPLRMRHYLYFPRAKEGKAVAALLRQRGFSVEYRKGADGVNWLVLAEHSLSPEDEAGLAVREELERLAQQHSGEYDGSETALSE
jgi:Regulator of ribonuclease activity B